MNIESEEVKDLIKAKNGFILTVKFLNSLINNVNSSHKEKEKLILNIIFSKEFSKSSIKQALKKITHENLDKFIIIIEDIAAKVI